MAKAPLAGRVKTRLSPPLTHEESAELAARLFADAAACARTATPNLFVACAPAGARDLLEPLLPPGASARWVAQRGADLGRRLASAVGSVFSQGYGPVAVIGTDSPTLPPAYISRALHLLSAGGADVALGPTEDGGYYLAALRAPAPSLFDRVDWSTERAYEQTARNASRLSLRLAELPRWYDVDTPADLLRLRRELFTDAAARGRAPATYLWLRGRGPARTGAYMRPSTRG